MKYQLSKISIFKGLTENEIASLLSKINYQIRSYKSDEILVYAGDECVYFHLLLEGTVRGEVRNFDGKSIAVSEIPAPGSFAEAYLFAKKNTFKINIRAISDVRIMLINKDYFNMMLGLNQKVLENYLRIISNRFVIVTEKLNFMMIKNAKGKIAHHILSLERDHPNEKIISFKRTHEQLATIMGITRPAFTKNLLLLKKEGLISIKKKDIKILDRKRLLALIS